MILSSHGKYGGNGGPQADVGVERKLSGINRELKEMGPQADDGGERQLENNKYPQMSQMDTDGGPQADFVGELLLTNDEGLFASSSSYASS